MQLEQTTVEMKVNLMRSIYLRRYPLAVGSLMLTAVISTKAAAVGINIAPDGVAIMGLSDSLDGTGDRLNFNQGNLEELNDEVFTPASPAGFNIGVGNGVDDYDVHLDGGTDMPVNDYVGILWDSPRSNVTSLSFQHYLANDGGWFGSGTQFLPGAALTAADLTVPVVQVSTNFGATWSNVPGVTDNYVSTLEGVTRGIAFGNSATSPFVTFNFPAQNGVTGIRVIGDGYGEVDGNGFSAFTEFKVFADTGTVFPTLNINTASGEMTLSTGTGSGLQIRGYTIESTTGIGALDESGWNTIANGTNQWTELPGVDSTMVLSEAAIAETATPVTLTASQNLSLGNIWTQNPFGEDIEAFVQLADGRLRRMEVRYNGQATNPLEVGDLNFDGNIDELDWPTVRDNYRADLTGLSTIEGYGLGDVNFDGAVDRDDLVEFKQLYNMANGAGSFESMLAGGASVPEPGTWAVLALGAVGAVLWRRRRV
jgi:hypothetical protein